MSKFRKYISFENDSRDDKVEGIDRRAFFLEGCRFGRYKEKKWIFSLFTVKRWNEDNLPNEQDLYQIFVKDGVYHTHLQNKPFTPILEKGEPIPASKTIMDLKEEFKLSPREIPNCFEETVTTPGVVFLNYYCLIQHLNNRVPFINGKFTAEDITSQIVPRVVDDVAPENRNTDSGEIYVSEMTNVLTAISQVAGFAPLNVPSATRYTVTTSPNMKALKARLIEENKDQLTDPATVAKITAEIIEEDKRWNKQDPYGGFLDVKKKSYTVTRKKLHGLQGLEFTMDGSKSQFIPNSLQEGIDIKTLPMLMDAVRGGSHSRGALTALGGVQVKFIFRAFNTSQITMEDCKTKLGIRVKASERILKNSMFCWIYDGISEIQIRPENLKSLVDENKFVILRSPGYCQAGKEGRSYCLHCMGEGFRGNEKALASYGAAVASKMNDIFMGAMHGKAVATQRWDFNETLS